MRIVIVTGEASGDVLAAGLIRELGRLLPGARFEGIAGPRMQALGCKSVYPMERLSVMGLFESFSRYPELIPLRGRLARLYQQQPPAIFIGVDAPDFNLHLEMKLHSAGIPTVHYVSPSVWAWRRYRIKKIRKAVDRMLVLFPFEKDFYAAHGVDAVFVGHPAADHLREEDRSSARMRLQIPANATVVALLPGSRITEVNYLADILVRAGQWLCGRIRNPRFLVPLVNTATRVRFEQALAEVADPGRFQLLDGDAHSAISAADAVLLASGTASLETLLLNRPMVITYRGHPLSWEIACRMLHVDHVGLPNLLAGRRLAPELLQNQARPAVLGAEILALLESPRARQRQLQAYGVIARQLRCNADVNAAQAVLALLDKRG